MIMPIIVPHIASSGGGAVSAESFAALLAFGSVIGLKVFVCLLIACIPIGAVLGWLQDDSILGAFMLALLVPMVAFAVWVVAVAVVHGLLWVVA